MALVAHKLESKPRTGDVAVNENVEFSSLLLSDGVLKGLTNAGFVKPSPIQLKAIPLGRCGLDLIVQAKSGTGKTCVFSVVALDGVVTEGSSLQILVLAPTREIAVQIWEVINSIGNELEGLCCYTFIGGLPVADDKIKLKRCHIAVGTPGRIKQLIEENVLITENVRLFILDEADKLLEEGFQESINWIYSTLPENKQMLALSATYPEALAHHLTGYMRNPTFIRLNADDPTLLGIRHYYKKVKFHPLAQKAFDYKVKELTNILSAVSFNQCLVFSNYQMRAQSLSDILNSSGWPSTYISGSQDQQHRLTAMAKLKQYKCRVLISTDLTSRGIDAENVNLVINLDIPKDHETYLHRIGRAGRFGTYGAGISLAAEGDELDRLYNIQQKCKTKILTLPDPIPSNLAHSSGYVNIDHLVTTEQIVTESEPCTIKCNSKDSVEPKQSSNNGTNIKSDMEENNKQQNSSDKKDDNSKSQLINVNNDNIISKGNIEKVIPTVDKKTSSSMEICDTTNSSDINASKRKILKSNRKKTESKKNPWSDWLNTNEETIHVETNKRDTGRETVVYTDVDIFSSGKKKGKTRKSSSKISGEGGNIYLTDKSSEVKAVDDQDNSATDRSDQSTSKAKMNNSSESVDSERGSSPSKIANSDRKLVSYDDYETFSSRKTKDKKKRQNQNDKVKEIEDKEKELDIVSHSNVDLIREPSPTLLLSQTEKSFEDQKGSGDHIAKPKQMWSKKYKNEKDPEDMSFEELLSSYVSHKNKLAEKGESYKYVCKELNISVEDNPRTVTSISKDKDCPTEDIESVDVLASELGSIDIKEPIDETITKYCNGTGQNTNDNSEIESLRVQVKQALTLQQSKISTPQMRTFEESTADYESFIKLDLVQQRKMIDSVLNKKITVSVASEGEITKLNEEENELTKKVEKLLEFGKMQQKHLANLQDSETKQSNECDVNDVKKINKKPIFMTMTASKVQPLGNDKANQNLGKPEVCIKTQDSSETEIENELLYQQQVNTTQQCDTVNEESSQDTQVNGNVSISDIELQMKGLDLRPPEDQSLGKSYIERLSAKLLQKEDGEISLEEGELNSSTDVEKEVTDFQAKSENVYRGKAFGEWVPVEPCEKYEYGDELLHYSYGNDTVYDKVDVPEVDGEYIENCSEEEYKGSKAEYYEKKKLHGKSQRHKQRKYWSKEYEDYRNSYETRSDDLDTSKEGDYYEQCYNDYYDVRGTSYSHRKNKVPEAALQYADAQQSMWAAYMNHVYWWSLGQTTTNMGSHHLQQMSTWHSQWAQYYNELYESEVQNEKLSRTYRSQKDYIHHMTSLNK